MLCTGDASLYNGKESSIQLTVLVFGTAFQYFTCLYHSSTLALGDVEKLLQRDL